MEEEVPETEDQPTKIADDALAQETELGPKKEKIGNGSQFQKQKQIATQSWIAK